MTAQTHELLILDGIETTMACSPPIPREHPRILALNPDEMARESHDFSVFSTACCRRYRGTWEIKEGRFYLKSLSGALKLVGSEPILASWFTGVIRIPKGKLKYYIHLGFLSLYEQELHVKIEKGVITDSRVIDYRGEHHDPLAVCHRNLFNVHDGFFGDEER